MGWDYTQGATKASIIEELSNPSRWIMNGQGGDHAILLDKALKGSTLWLVWEVKQGLRLTRFIECNLLQSNRNFGWGYKSMDHNMGPYDHTCPLSFLTYLRPEDMQQYGNEWAARLRGHNARAIATTNKWMDLNEGDEVKLVNGKTAVITQAVQTGKSARTRKVVGRVGMTQYKIRAKDLA